MSDNQKLERLGLRGTLDLISNALRTVGTANATGAITAGASFRFIPDLQWAIKQITMMFLFGILAFAISYMALLITTIEMENPNKHNGRIFRFPPYQNQSLYEETLAMERKMLRH